MNNLSIPKYSAKQKPIKNMRLPNKPNKCIGRLPNFDKNQMVIRSKNPLTNLLIPNLVCPYLRAWCTTTFSSIFVNPWFLANTGI